MGLKTSCYVSKSTGVVLNNAYAMLGELVIGRNNQARALFLIQASRENVQSFKPLDEVYVFFTWDRKQDPAKQAYEEAKKQVIEADDEYGEKTTRKAGVLFGWENDYEEK